MNDYLCRKIKFNCDMTKFFRQFLYFILKYKYYLLAFIILTILTIVGSNNYIKSAVQESYNEIQDEITYGIFENNKAFGIREKTYTIVPFKLDSIPSKDRFTDKSEYDQQYGLIDHYYKAGGGWVIYVFEKSGDVVYQKNIEPFAVGTSQSTYFKSSPEDLFRRMYNYIIEDEDYNVDLNNENKISKLKNLKSRFHHIKIESNDYWDGSLIWYSSGHDKMYSKVSYSGKYQITRDDTTINLYYWLLPIISIVLEILILIGLYQLFRKKQKIKKKKSGFKLGITLNKSSEDLPEANTDVKDLLEKINPSNFMNPYDAEKVKIANDLYSALLKAMDNETIISMIRDKAISELGIQL